LVRTLFALVVVDALARVGPRALDTDLLLLPVAVEAAAHALLGSVGACIFVVAVVVVAPRALDARLLLLAVVIDAASHGLPIEALIGVVALAHVLPLTCAAGLVLLPVAVEAAADDLVRPILAGLLLVARALVEPATLDAYLVLPLVFTRAGDIATVAVRTLVRIDAATIRDPRVVDADLLLRASLVQPARHRLHRSLGTTRRRVGIALGGVIDALPVESSETSACMSSLQAEASRSKRARAPGEVFEAPVEARDSSAKRRHVADRSACRLMSHTTGAQG
jgi:hypothetical protein